MLQLTSNMQLPKWKQLQLASKKTKETVADFPQHPEL